MNTYIVIDIGGTAIKYGLMDQNGIFIEKSEIPTESNLGGKNILKKVLTIVSTYVKSNTISGVSISTAGMVDPDSGEIIFASELIPDYAGINYKKEIYDKFLIPCEVENDVNCAGLAESISGASKGSFNSVMLTIGTGIGGSFIINNHVYHGYSNSACEIGRMLVDGKPFETQAAASILVKKVAAQKKDDASNWNGKKIFELARRGDTDCNQAINEMADTLGKGIATICYMANPEVVVLGGGVMAQGEFLKERLLTSVSEHLPEMIYKNTRIEFAKQGNDAGMVGAFYNFIQKHPTGI